jgi:hypothetical protein
MFPFSILLKEDQDQKQEQFNFDAENEEKVVSSLHFSYKQNNIITVQHLD